MNSQRRYTAVSDDGLRLLHERSKSFEAALKSDHPVSLKDELEKAPENLRATLFQKLLTIELAWRLSQSQQPTASEYEVQFPDQCDEIGRLIAEICEEDSSSPETLMQTLDTTVGGRVSNSEGASTLFGQSGSTSLPRGSTTKHNIADDYELCEELGRGGMGVVYKARQVSLNRMVALKLILAGQLASDQDLMRFRAEAEAAARLEHVGIVPIHEVGEHEGQHYLCMGLVEGPSLAEKVSEGPMPPREAAAYMLQVSEAIAFAHRRGVIHRDLKPANILVDESGQPKVTDFGLAKNKQDDSGLTATGQILGTPSFMPPEQAIGDVARVGPQADVYALGATLYNLLTGRPPFMASNPLDTLRQVLNQEPISPTQFNATIDKDLETICLKCLQKEETARYSLADDLAMDLQCWLNGEPISARPIGRLVRSWRWCMRNKVVSLLAAAVVFCLLMGTCVSLMFGLEASQRAADAALQSTRADIKANDAAREALAARTNLYRSLLREAEAIRLARQPGYRREVWDRVRQAMEIETPEKDHRRLRQEAVACLGDFVGLDPIVSGDFDERILSHALDRSKNLIAVGLADGSVSFRDLQAGVEIARLDESQGKPGPWARFHANGTDLLTATAGGSGFIWRQDPSGVWKVSDRFTTGSWRYMQAISMTPDSTKMVTGEDDTVTLWNIGYETPARTYHVDGRIISASLSPDGRLVVAGFFRPDGSFAYHVWDTTNDEPPRVLVPDMESHIAVGFSPDGQLLACAGREGLLLFETTSFRKVGFRRGHMCRWVCFSPDSQTIAFASEQQDTVHLWQHAVNRDRAVLRHPGHPAFVEFDQDGQTLASADPKSLRIWRLTSEEHQQLAAHHGGVPGGLFDGMGHFLSISKDKTVHISEIESGKILNQLPLPDLGQCMSLHPQGRLLATGVYNQGTVQIWDLETRELVANIPQEYNRKKIHAVAFSPDGNLLAVGGVPGLGLYRVESAGDAESRELRVSLDRIQHGPPPESDVGHLCFSPDNRFLAWTSDYGVTHIWDLEDQRELTSPGKVYQRIQSLAFLPDSERLVFLNSDREITIWNVQQGEVISRYPTHNDSDEGSSYAVYVGLHPGGDFLAVSSRSGRGVNIWDLRNGELTLELPRSRGTVWCMRWNEDGTQLAACRSNGDLGIWNLEHIRKQVSDLQLDW